MNVHHLELFFYVAKHGGISEAVRHMPYGIQQPAMSAQLLRLEDDLGVKLFTRRPFSLTPAGGKLFQFVEPFFGNLETVATALQPEVVAHLRIGAPELVFRDHLPEVLVVGLAFRTPKAWSARSEGANRAKDVSGIPHNVDNPKRDVRISQYKAVTNELLSVIASTGSRAA